MKICSVILFYFSFNYIFFNGNTRYLLVEIDVEKEQQEVLAPERIGSKCWGNFNSIFVYFVDAFIQLHGSFIGRFSKTD